MSDLEKKVWNDLGKVNIPARDWVLHQKPNSDVLDVAIIGAGMGGKCAALALMKQGINHFQLFDENENGKEGPWLNFARMRTLRSDKHDLGPSLSIPSLTFKSWFAATYGEDHEKELEYAPTKIWNDYLNWFGEVLKLPIVNQKKLLKIIPQEHYLELQFDNASAKARKVVLATGQGGSGCCDIPDYMSDIPKTFYLHTGEVFESKRLAGKKIAIVGAGTSAFDASGVALEAGAKEVKVLVRRNAIPHINEFAEFAFHGMLEGFYHLSDEKRCQFFIDYLQGAAPPKEAIERVSNFNNFKIYYACQIQKVTAKGNSLILSTNRGETEVDLLIFGTGYSVDLTKRPELDLFREHIKLWKSMVSKEFSYLGNFPYLGRHFEFLGDVPFLKNVYCFNNGASMSHGLISNDVPGISIGAERLAKGIAIDLFLKESDLYLETLRSADIQVFDPNKYKILMDNNF